MTTHYFLVYFDTVLIIPIGYRCLKVCWEVMYYCDVNRVRKKFPVYAALPTYKTFIVPFLPTQICIDGNREPAACGHGCPDHSVYFPYDLCFFQTLNKNNNLYTVSVDWRCKRNTVKSTSHRKIMKLVPWSEHFDLFYFIILQLKF